MMNLSIPKKYNSDIDSLISVLGINPKLREVLDETKLRQAIFYQIQGLLRDKTRLEIIIEQCHLEVKYAIRDQKTYYQISFYRQAKKLSGDIKKYQDFMKFSRAELVTNLNILSKIPVEIVQHVLVFSGRQLYFEEIAARDIFNDKFVGVKADDTAAYEKQRRLNELWLNKSLFLNRIRQVITTNQQRQKQKVLLLYTVTEKIKAALIKAALQFLILIRANQIRFKRAPLPTNLALSRIPTAKPNSPAYL